MAGRYRYVGVEPDAASCEVARVRLAASGSGGEVRHGDLAAVRADELFDLVCAFEVIEHIEDDEGALGAWVGHLRPGGSLIVSTPAWQHRFAAADRMVGHFRRYDPAKLEDLLLAAGLEGVRVTQYGAPLGYVLETARNAVGRRRLAKSEVESREARTTESGRLLQPNDGIVARRRLCGCVAVLQAPARHARTRAELAGRRAATASLRYVASARERAASL